MQDKEAVIFEPAHTPNQNWVKDLDPRQMDSTLSSFIAPKNDKREPFGPVLVIGPKPITKSTINGQKVGQNG